MATNSVLSAFRVLEAVAEKQPIGLSELARHVGLPKSTTQRCLLTLDEIGWVQPSSSSPTRWGLTYRIVSLSRQAGEQHGLRTLALPVMNDLQHATTETVHLAAPDGNALVLIERLDTPHSLRAFLPLGERIPLHASATGLAYLAACPDDRVDHYLAGELRPVTSSTMTSPAEIRAALDKIRERGYSINEQGLSEGIASLGAALTDRSGDPVGAISVSGPSSRIVPERFDELGRQVATASQQISRRL